MSVSESPTDFEEWREAAYEVWRSVAPSYVQHDVTPLSGHLREMHGRGVPIDRFREALELAFAKDGVTQRRAIFYAYGILRNQFKGDD